MARHDLVNLLFINHLNQPFAATDVVADPAVGKPIDHGTIIHHVSTKQHFALLVMETNAASGMAWHVKNSKLTVAKVDNVTWRRRKGRKCGNWILSLHCSTDTAEAVSTDAHMKQRRICEEDARVSLLLLQLMIVQEEKC